MGHEARLETGAALSEVFATNLKPVRHCDRRLSLAGHADLVELNITMIMIYSTEFTLLPMGPRTKSEPWAPPALAICPKGEQAIPVHLYPLVLV